MNKVQLTGRLTDEIEVRTTQTNRKVCRFRLAVKRSVKDKDGNYLTDFITVQCWEQRAEFLSNYAHKGTMIGVTGCIETRNYENSSGQKVYETYVSADGVEIIAQPAAARETDTSKFGGRSSNSYASIGPEELPFY